SALKDKQQRIERLYFYCSILLQASVDGTTRSLVILQEIQQMLFQAKADILLEKLSHNLLSPVPTKLTQTIEKTKETLLLFFQSLYPYFMQLRLSETILLYLLENQVTLNSILGKGAIESLLH